MGSGFCRILSTIDFVKKIAKQCGWNGEKTLENRKFLSGLKDLLIEWNNVPFNKIIEDVKDIEYEWQYYGINPDRTIIFIDCREPTEIKKLCDALNAKSLLITCKRAEDNETSNHADQQILNYNYDIIIENNGSLKDFEHSSLDFINNHKYFKENPIV